MDQFAPFLKINGCFVVKNISPQVKTIKIFQYPILYNDTRDLLQIPGVAEADIRASLLKGELQHKIRAQDIVVICSDIDLLQFNANQKIFLQNAGIVNGLDASSAGGLTPEQHQTLRQLIHLADGVGGPMEGFGSNSYRETLPVASAFPTSIVWWTSSAKLQKIVEKELIYTGINPTTINWKVYDSTGSLLATMTDTITYDGPFELSRTRVMS